MGSVYPRVCGGTPHRRSLDVRAHGLSPRVRGNHARESVGPAPRGSIPACAGEPPPLSHPGPPRRVYPRVCGGTLAVGDSRQGREGLSPRVRGNPVCAHRGAVRGRSIPACAGEPRLPRLRAASCEVYPRVCGGTALTGRRCTHERGLSPRVRGNRDTRKGVDAAARSIPACAGEPCPPACAAQSPGVYPPRVRGNRKWGGGGGGGGSCGSIPACAGEPTQIVRTYADSRVYPRVCGGTPPPPLRARIRSIPACAGEPCPGSPSAS